MLTEQLRELLSVRQEHGPADPIARHRSISRITLRRILLAGLEDRVHFGKRLVRYEQLPDNGFALYFEDGTSARADVVVGADGVNSAVRKRYLPDHDPVHTGVLEIGGKVPLSDGVMALAPDCLLDGPVIVLPPEPCSLFMAIWKRSPDANHLLRRLGIEEPLAGDENYLVLGFGGARTYFAPDGDDPAAIPPRTLKEVLRRTVARWHPNLRKLTEMLDEREMSVNCIRTSRPMRHGRRRELPYSETRSTA